MFVLILDVIIVFLTMTALTILQLTTMSCNDGFNGQFRIAEIKVEGKPNTYVHFGTFTWYINVLICQELLL